MAIRIVYLLLFASLLNSCKPISRLLMGAKPAKTEQTASLLHWLNKHVDKNISANDVLTLAPEGFPMAFDVNPIMITQNNTCILYNGCTKSACFKSLADLLKLYQSEADITNSPELAAKQLSFKKDSSLVQPFFRTIDGKPVQNFQNNTLILPFALFLGHTVQKRELLQFVQSAKANKKVNWTIYYLSIDKQQWWGEYWNRYITMGVH